MACGAARLGSCRGEQPRARVEGARDVAHGPQVVLSHEVGLVQDDRVGKLELVHEQRGHKGVFVGLDLGAAEGGRRTEAGDACEVAREGGRVNDGDASVCAPPLATRMKGSPTGSGRSDVDLKHTSLALPSRA